MPAHVAGALVGRRRSFARDTDASEARAALAEVAARAEVLPTRGGLSRTLLQHARDLERSVRQILGDPRSFVC